MNGVWSNQDILKIVADPNRILSGYLNAYLCTRFGVPFVVSGKYGSVITHLEPKHFADLLVPRLGKTIEQEAHDLVEQSAALLTQFQANLTEATELYFDSVGLKDLTASEWHSWGPDLGFTAKAGVKSLRALNFNPRFNQLCDRIKQGPWKPLGELCVSGTLKRGVRFSRVDADPEYAYRLIGQRNFSGYVHKGGGLGKILSRAAYSLKMAVCLWLLRAHSANQNFIVVRNLQPVRLWRTHIQNIFSVYWRIRV
jgi:type I restriction enzyme S subunit